LEVRSVYLRETPVREVRLPVGANVEQHVIGVPAAEPVFVREFLSNVRALVVAPEPFQESDQGLRAGPGLHHGGLDQPPGLQGFDDAPGVGRLQRH